MKLCSAFALITGVTSMLSWTVGAAPGMSDNSQVEAAKKPWPQLQSNIERPLRYYPVSDSFVIINGAEFFNRPLYGGNTAFRVDAGDRPEFSLYLPGRGGNLRLGIQTSTGAKWLHSAGTVVASYRPGSMDYDIRDPLLESSYVRINAIAAFDSEDLLIRIETDSKSPLTLLMAFGGVSGEKGSRGGDIGSESKPSSEFFRLREEQLKGDSTQIANNTFSVRGKGGFIGGVLPVESQISLASFAKWSDPATAAPQDPGKAGSQIVFAKFVLQSGQPAFLLLRRLAASRSLEAAESSLAALGSDQLEQLFNEAQSTRARIAGRVRVQTPDPYLNAAASALNIAADAVWDEREKAFMHGAVAWRKRLLGWRAAYTGDALGWHDRTREHLEGYAREQNTNAIPDRIPAPETSANLSRNETALHSNGDMTRSHYDMNLVGIDAFFRHLRWNGDTNFAARMWPVLERHLAWEERLFRREFGPERLPLYEGYCCIWASDDLAYNGGGATHSSAYNAFHHRLAAELGKILGKDGAAYGRESDAILRAMRSELWLPREGWFGEWKDLLGEGLVHPEPALWTFYHTIDSEIPSPIESWQMTRFLDTRGGRIPLRGPGVPSGCETLSTTRWMPYTWSLNNVVMAETVHTSLAYWQAGRAEEAMQLFKGAILDSMYLGLCPGNVGMATYFDANRRESQRDFADAIGITSRAFVEGLFGVRPDLLNGVIALQPGFPAGWTNASIHHPDFDFAYTRDRSSETLKWTSRFPKPAKLVVTLNALTLLRPEVTANGVKIPVTILQDAVGRPKIQFTCDSSASQTVILTWHGPRPPGPPASRRHYSGSTFDDSCNATIVEWLDPQHLFGGEDTLLSTNTSWMHAQITGVAGHRTAFAKLHAGDMTWWQPISIEVRSLPVRTSPQPMTKAALSSSWVAPKLQRPIYRPIPLEAHFNDNVTQLFKHQYLAPRSTNASLATPVQGYGSWCHPADTFEVDDSGLRATAATNGGSITLPQGVPFKIPTAPGAFNILFTSQWTHFPKAQQIPLDGHGRRLYLLMAGTTHAMQSRFDNGEIIVEYGDGSRDRLALRNPETWWPIDQDYFTDDFGFRLEAPLPIRVDLKTGRIRKLDPESFKGQGGRVPGGAATVLEMRLNSSKALKSFRVRTIANEVVIGLMAATVEE